MNFQKIEELAQEFQVKLALKDEAPPNVRAKDIKWIDDVTRKEIRDNGKNHEYIPHDKSHNPPGAIASEKTWDKAKKAVKKYWKKYDEPWAVVYHVYENMGGKPKKKKKGKKKKSELINTLFQKCGQFERLATEPCGCNYEGCEHTKAGKPCSNPVTNTNLGFRGNKICNDCWATIETGLPDL